MRLGADGRRRATLIGTFAAAVILAIMPFPNWAEPFRPDWVGLVLIYWCLAIPDRVSVGTGWLVARMTKAMSKGMPPASMIRK